MRNLQILACHVSDNLAYLALNNCEICAYSIIDNSLHVSFKAWQNEEVIFLRALKTIYHNYLLIVYRSSAILYSIKDGSAQKVSQYSLNSKKSQEFKGGQASKY